MECEASEKVCVTSCTTSQAQSRKLASCVHGNSITKRILQSISRSWSEIIFCYEIIQGRWNDCVCHPPSLLGGWVFGVCWGVGEMPAENIVRGTQGLTKVWND